LRHSPIPLLGGILASRAKRCCSVRISTIRTRMARFNERELPRGRDPDSASQSPGCEHGTTPQWRRGRAARPLKHRSESQTVLIHTSALPGSPSKPDTPDSISSERSEGRSDHPEHRRSSRMTTLAETLPLPVRFERVVSVSARRSFGSSASTSNYAGSAGESGRSTRIRRVCGTSRQVPDGLRGTMSHRDVWQAPLVGHVDRRSGSHDPVPSGGGLPSSSTIPFRAGRHS
jgi:hypothetical protein